MGSLYQFSGGQTCLRTDQSAISRLPFWVRYPILIFRTFFLILESGSHFPEDADNEQAW